MLYPFYDLIYNPKGPHLGGVVLSSVVSMTCMTFYEVGAPVRLCGGPSPATNIPVVHTLFMAIQSTFDLEPEEPQKRYEKNGRVTAIIFVKKSSK